MAFTINNNLILIGNMQFMNSSQNKLVKNLLNNYFKYLREEFNGNLIQLVKQKVIYQLDI